MDIVAADFTGEMNEMGHEVKLGMSSDHWFDRGVDRFAARMRVAQLMLGAKVVEYNSVNTFAGRVLKACDGKPIRRLCVVDHGYRNVGMTYDSQVTGETHAWVHLEFGREIVGHNNFDSHEKAFGLLTPVLRRDSKVVFLNCQGGRDPMLLYRFAKLWGCPVAGSTVDQRVIETVNMWIGEWVTVHPDKRHERTTTHPLYG